MIYLVSITWGVVSQSPEPGAHVINAGPTNYNNYPSINEMYRIKIYQNEKLTIKISQNIKNYTTKHHIINSAYIRKPP